ncbi:hypothetical protein EVAR_85471_1 [Eumeta japonica]|uniref:Uncharacterized protein n=1 Tax=Eumeta variegata TaxID=151549 RepID=A0A4C1VE37_EUMVA|nr:hypothetical protein EVAR_85471_1 [Eumeta japonica]
MYNKSEIKYMPEINSVFIARCRNVIDQKGPSDFGWMYNDFDAWAQAVGRGARLRCKGQLNNEIILDRRIKVDNLTDAIGNVLVTLLELRVSMGDDDDLRAKFVPSRTNYRKGMAEVQTAHFRAISDLGNDERWDLAHRVAAGHTRVPRNVIHNVIDEGVAALNADAAIENTLH